ncbi:glycosyl transferase family 2 [Flavobacterium araucananum]|uniref:Glycosyltransferase 2-like domain-containing protein n=1 Tax=Flavobacterium araucananum TaxID=946678 RepID=A0A227PEM7_9FLAO|nr:glycosyltransferase family 2 protein [Flavobacterium araucananum]OXG08337.1 hypothetical protein B0A64_06135 [Flavobacterium araucananum]PWJ99132.1 glycosyl transferase family 2 [Flavobacterium araucananum]
MFTVVIPLYNKENYIERSVRSVLNQTLVEFELLVINDGSTDKSEEVVKDIKDNRITLINKVNGGESSARNLGIKNAKYDFVAFLDADDIWDPKFLFEICEIIKKYPAAGIYTSNYYIQNNQNELLIALKSKIFNKCMLLKDYFKLSRNIPVITSNTAVIRKNVFLEVSDFDVNITMGPDLEMWYRIAKKYHIAFTPLIGATYCQDANDRICNVKRNINYNFFSKIIDDFQIELNANFSKKSEIRYINELVIKDVKEILKTNSALNARIAIFEYRKMGVKIFLWRLYYLSTYFPIALFKTIHKLNVFLLDHYENIFE